VCGAARDAAAGVVHRAVKVRVADHDPANLECRLAAGGKRLDIVAQASPQAWTEYDTMTSHQDQVYGSGGFHEPGQIPKSVAGVGVEASWIAAESELVATNGTPTRGGSYVTVTVTGRSKTGPTPLALARVTASATLASGPRGPNPGSPQ
jgi:hypothetical protein